MVEQSALMDLDEVKSVGSAKGKSPRPSNSRKGSGVSQSASEDVIQHGKGVMVNQKSTFKVPEADVPKKAPKRKQKVDKTKDIAHKLVKPRQPRKKKVPEAVPLANIDQPDAVSGGKIPAREKLVSTAKLKALKSARDAKEVKRIERLRTEGEQIVDSNVRPQDIWELKQEIMSMKEHIMTMQPPMPPSTLSDRTAHEQAAVENIRSGELSWLQGPGYTF